jgi:hypothetical protein
MSDGNDLDIVETFAKANRERITAEDEAAGSVEKWRADLRGLWQ